MIPDLIGVGDRRVGLLAACLVVVSACTEDEGPHGAQLLVPDDVLLHWDDSFNREGDGLGALVPIDVMVYDGVSGEPLAGAEVVIEASDTGTWLLLEEDFVVVEPEGCLDCALPSPDLVPDPADASARIPNDLAAGESDPAPRGTLGAEFLWDAHRDQYFALQLLEAEGLDDAGAELHDIALDTDPDGLARVYVYVDAFPWDDGAVDFDAVSVLVSLGTSRPSRAEQSFDLIPR